MSTEKVTPIVPGSVVSLKSGGDLMTVEKIDGDKAICVWQHSKPTSHAKPQFSRERFPLVTLLNEDDRSYDV